MWMASLDFESGGFPAAEPRAGKRVYRNIDAPQGCSLYWDQPLVTATRLAARARGEAPLAAAAEAYTREFLAKCVAGNGLFLWGNHYYFRPDLDRVMKFFHIDDPQPITAGADDGALHETRPLTPNWQSFWEIDPAATERSLRAMAAAHIYDDATGGFNRHADRKRDHAFLEAGGVLVESLAWLAARTADRGLLAQAIRVAEFSFNHRGPTTALVENNPTTTRWDKWVATSEVGLWARCLLRAERCSGESRFGALARAALAAYLRHAYDPVSQRFYGMVQVADGKPVLGRAETEYQPSDFCDFWHPLFPRHDYPFHTIEAAFTLYRATGDEVFYLALERWGQWLKRELEARRETGAYAEHYGRALHALASLATVWPDAGYEELARRTREDAVRHLWVRGLFRGHPGEDRCDSVDGVGYLLLAMQQQADPRLREDPEAELFF